MDLKHELLEFEQEGWDALSGNEGARYYDEHMTEDAVMVVPGMLLDRRTVVRSIDEASPWSDYTLSEADVVPLTDDSAILTYRALAQREGQDPYEALVSTVYTRRDGRWKVAFHQQTPIPN